MIIPKKILTLVILSFATVTHIVANDSLSWVAPDSFLIPVDTILIDNSFNTYSVSEMEFPQVLPKSPEASAFQKYGEIRGNEYMGTPSISIPFYTLSYKGVELPIALSYDGDGVLVAQEASWVGLGWNLSIGGCINYVTQGGNDQYLSKSGNWTNDYLKVFNSNPATHFKLRSNFAQVPYVGTQSEDINGMFADLNADLAERDFYSVNLLGHSFLYFKNPYTDNFEIIGNYNEVFQIKTLANNCWEITDVDGIRYTFEEKEYSQQNAWGGYVSAWNLTKITTPQGGIITFGYSKLYSYNSLANFSQYYNFIKDYKILIRSNQATYPNDGGSYASISMGVWKIEKKYLSSIKTDDGTVEITLHHEDRKDLPGAQRLKDIEVRTPLANKQIKKITFQYSYFSSCMRGGNYLANPQRTSYTNSDYDSWSDQEKLRLKLNSVSEVSVDGMEELTTSFEYYGKENGVDSLLPVKSSCAIDFWGYYNGEENRNPYYGQVNNNGYTHGLMPKPSDCYIGNLDGIDSKILDLKGVNRFSNEKFMKIGTLHKITYPTKGYTVYDFEAHRFFTSMTLPCVSDSTVKGSEYKVEDINFKADGTHPGSGPTSQVRFVVPADSWGELKLTMQGRDESTLRLMASKDAYVRLVQAAQKPIISTYYMKTYYVDYSKQTSEVTIPKINMPAGTYVLEANLPEEVGNWDFKAYPNYIGGSLVVKSKNANSSSKFIDANSVGGGLRIQRVSNYQENGALVNRVVYDYTDKGKSTGIALVPPFVVCEKEYYWTTPSFLASYNILRYGSNLIGRSAYTSSLYKGNIGYSSVRKNIYDKDDKLVRYIVSTFQNIPAKAIFNDYYQFSEYTNGNLISQSIFDSKGNLQENLSNNYDRKWNRMFKCNAFLEQIMKGDVTSYKQGLYRTEEEKLYLLTVYSYYSQWHPIIKTTKTIYGKNGKNEEVISYEYNDKNHLVSSQIQQNSASQNKHKITCLYPCDLSNSICGMMTDRFYLSPVLTQKSYLDDVLASTKQVEFTDIQTTSKVMMLPSLEKYSLGGNDLETRMEYQYDDSGNIIQLSKDNMENVVYLWSYAGSYPIMEIKGASYSDISKWIGYEKISDLSKKTPTVADILEIQSLLSSYPVLCKGYLYFPGVGISQVIDSNGTSNYYNYDTFNRLKSIKNNEGNVLQNYHYNYKK